MKSRFFFFVTIVSLIFRSDQTIVASIDVRWNHPLPMSGEDLQELVIVDSSVSSGVDTSRSIDHRSSRCAQPDVALAERSVALVDVEIVEPARKTARASPTRSTCTSRFFPTDPDDQIHHEENRLVQFALPSNLFPVESDRAEKSKSSSSSSLFFSSPWDFRSSTG